MSDIQLLRTERLCKTYPDGQVNALVDVTISIRHSEFVAIMGASGCGKSTLLNLLGGLDRPTSGEVFYEDRPLSAIPDLDRFRAQKIGFVFQSFFLLPTLTALENVQIPMFEGPLSARQRSARANELLKLVGMSHRLHHRPPKLSVGERQRIAIARSLANDPLLLLADEPTGNLDSRTAAEVLDLFAHLHRDKGMTLVLVTHGQEVANRAERIIRMRDGQIYAEERVATSKMNSATS
jgi:ABC-type lipoprotein export system ATPase subunit